MENKRTYTAEEMVLARTLLKHIQQGKSVDFVEGFLEAMVRIDDGERATEDAERMASTPKRKIQISDFPKGWDSLFFQWKDYKLDTEEFRKKMGLSQDRFVELLDVFIKEFGGRISSPTTSCVSSEK